MSEDESKQKEKKVKRKIDKSQIAIKIVAIILASAMVLPLVATAILYIIGD